MLYKVYSIAFSELSVKNCRDTPCILLFNYSLAVGNFHMGQVETDEKRIAGTEN